MSTEFKKGDRIVFVEDDHYDGIEMPKGTRGTYDEDYPINAAPYVLLDTGERVPAWRDRIAHAEDHGTGDGSASDICAEPGCNCDLERRFPAPVVVWDGKGKIPMAAHHVHTTAGECVKSRDGERCPAPLDPAKVAITIKGGDYIEAESDGTKIGGKVSRVTERGFVAIEHLGEFAVHHITPSPLPEGYRMFVLTAHTPAPEHEPVAGLGSAYVFGMVAQGIPQRRYHGFLLADGKFKFLDNDGRLTAAPTDRFDAFEPEPKPE